MMEKQACENCHFFRLEPLQKHNGTCRINERQGVPVPNPGGGFGAIGYWPPVDSGQWCGKWKSGIEALAEQNQNLIDHPPLVGVGEPGVRR